MSDTVVCILLLWWMQSVCLSFLLPPLKMQALNHRTQKCVSKYEFGVSVSVCWINNHMNWLNFAFALPSCLGGVFFLFAPQSNTPKCPVSSTSAHFIYCWNWIYLAHLFPTNFWKNHIFSRECKLREPFFRYFYFLRVFLKILKIAPLRLTYKVLEKYLRGIWMSNLFSYRLVCVLFLHFFKGCLVAYSHLVSGVTSMPPTVYCQSDLTLRVATYVNP